jgi:hypothetical protein
MLAADTASTRSADTSGYPLFARYTGRRHLAGPGCSLAWRARLGFDAVARGRGAGRAAHSRGDDSRVGEAGRWTVDRCRDRAYLAWPRVGPRGGEPTRRPVSARRGPVAPGRNDRSRRVRRCNRQFLDCSGRPVVERDLGHILFLAGRRRSGRGSAVRFPHRACRSTAADRGCEPGAVRPNGRTPYAGCAKWEWETGWHGWSLRWQ